MKLGLHPKGVTSTEVSENGVLRGTYRHSPTYATVNVPEGMVQVGTYGQAYEEGPVEIQHTGMRSPTACVIAHLRFITLSFPYGKMWRALQNKLFQLYFVTLLLLLLLLLFRKSETA
jgi:hypothetical protein